MSFVNNIQTVSHYESKLLVRSRFFRLFSLLTFLALSLWNTGMLLANNNVGWLAKAIPANIPLMNLLILNAGQTVTAIFLASDFLKRDRKLDTSEVFFVRPLSNAEYIFGKIWGNLRVFFLLNFAAMGLSVLFTLPATDASVDWGAYVIYFLLLSVPSLVYTTGLSVFLMLMLRNQALCFILLLGYMGLTLFYIGDAFGGLFDYAAFYLPLVKSAVAGFAHTDLVLTQRAMYTLAGLGCMFLVVLLFDRLSDAPRSNYLWAALSAAMFLLCGLAGHRHLNRIETHKRLRASYTATYQRYEHAPALRILRYDIKLKQAPLTFAAEAKLQGLAPAADSVFFLCLNPGLEVKAVREANRPATFTRDRQMLRIHFGRTINRGDTLSLAVDYEGALDPVFCYADIPHEELTEANRLLLFNPGKQYMFQTPGYALFTPESYWYPRPVEECFSRFSLHVLPLRGLVALSQGEETVHADGAYSFASESPLRAISLAIGKYRQMSVVAGGVTYSLRSLEGSRLDNSFCAIRDSIPALVQNFREDMERKFRITSPFKRFSVIETPAAFASYPRTGSQAQEMIQPEMLFLPENGWPYSGFDVNNVVKEKVKWAQRNGQSLNEEEAQTDIFNELLRKLFDPADEYSYESSGRGNWEAVPQANPYFIYPHLYSARYNVISPHLPAANYLIESYLQSQAGDLPSDNVEREQNGIHQQEKASLLLEKQSFAAVLADARHRKLLGALIGLEASRLFAPAEVRMGLPAFRDSLYAVLERNSFCNVAFEDLLAQLSGLSRTDLLAGTQEWKRPMQLPVYHIRQPEVTQYTKREQETFVMKVVLSNDSDQDGFVWLSVQGESRPGQTNDVVRKMALPARQGKQWISVWEHAPRTVTIHTGLSGNLPNVIRYTVSGIKQERGAPTDREGDSRLAEASPNAPVEVVVDNEDAGLFELSDPPVTGLLLKWLDKTEDASFPYAGVNRRLSFRWTATTHADYYGKYIRSAYVIRNGNGSQTATWKVPVPSPGYYDLYYYMSDVYHQGNDNSYSAEYRFRIAYDEETEDAYLNLQTADKGWTPIGACYVASDTIRITLTNECEWRRLSADAIRIVKRE
jgi:ABC-type transport system involved in multi-copper enzyme maturation permease subunit